MMPGSPLCNTQEFDDKFNAVDTDTSQSIEFSELVAALGNMLYANTGGLTIDQACIKRGNLGLGGGCQQSAAVCDTAFENTFNQVDTSGDCLIQNAELEIPLTVVLERKFAALGWSIGKNLNETEACTNQMIPGKPSCPSQEFSTKFDAVDTNQDDSLEIAEIVVALANKLIGITNGLTIDQACTNRVNLKLQAVGGCQQSAAKCDTAFENAFNHVDTSDDCLLQRTELEIPLRVKLEKGWGNLGWSIGKSLSKAEACASQMMPGSPLCNTQEFDDKFNAVDTDTSQSIEFSELVAAIGNMLYANTGGLTIDQACDKGGNLGLE